MCKGWEYGCTAAATAAALTALHRCFVVVACLSVKSISVTVMLSSKGILMIVPSFPVSMDSFSLAKCV